jgi:hypothetical protein
MYDPRNMRRTTFNTPEEIESSREDLDGLLATCVSLANWIDGAMPKCRESSMALTKLEEFVMWTKLAVLKKDEEKWIADHSPDPETSREIRELMDALAERRKRLSDQWPTPVRDTPKPTDS